MNALIVLPVRAHPRRKGKVAMKEWFQSRQDKRVTVETLLPDEKGGSYTGTVAWVGDDAVVIQLPSQQRLIAFHAIESAVDAQAF
jgi:ribosome maturation factor RimP